VRTADFDYQLPEELIAQHPLPQRDSARLLVLERASGRLEHHLFNELPKLLRPGDLLILNDSRVIPARLFATKASTGARIELFLLQRLEDVPTGSGEIWQALARPARRLQAGEQLLLGDGFCCRIAESEGQGLFKVVFPTGCDVLSGLARYGQMPLPPYIHRPAAADDAENYQTVYALHPGSVAAPTAGLHFSPQLLAELRATGIETASVTLHVGLGTFRPVQAELVEEHRMHAEAYTITGQTAAAINCARHQGRRVVCVGTTAVRTLESAVRAAANGNVEVVAGSSTTDIFIYPGGPGFRVTDALITNFHLPQSTLLMLVCAFATRQDILDAYAEAINQRYRFFSYGDAMLIL
jgi:S-adenosylmethionine:tRNA ribosyltransferase-isomerase